MSSQCEPWQLLCRWEHRNDDVREDMTDTIPSNIAEINKQQLYIVGGIGLALVLLVNL